MKCLSKGWSFVLIPFLLVYLSASPHLQLWDDLMEAEEHFVAPLQHETYPLATSIHLNHQCHSCLVLHPQVFVNATFKAPLRLQLEHRGQSPTRERVAYASSHLKETHQRSPPA